MAISDYITVPNSKKTSGKTSSSSAISKFITMPSQKEQEKAAKLATISRETSALAAESKKANSFGGILMSTLKGVARSITAIPKAMYNSVVHPDAHQKEFEQYALPKAETRLGRTLEFVPQQVMKFVSRLTNPGVEPLGVDAGERIKLKRLAKEAEKTGDWTQAIAFVARSKTLDKKWYQIFGDSAQAVLTVYAPKVGIEKALAKPMSDKFLFNLAQKSVATGLETGLPYAGAQIASSGDFSAKNIANTTTQNVAGGTMFGAISPILGQIGRKKVPIGDFINVPESVTPDAQVAPSQYSPELRQEIETKVIGDKSKAIIIDADSIKKMNPVYDNKNPNVLHEESSAISKELYTKAIDQDTSGVVKMTAGGAGSGKTEVILNKIKDQPSVIFDGVMSNPDSASVKIDYALSKGKAVEIHPVYTPVELASLFNSMRSRTVPTKPFTEGHFGYRDTIPKLVEKYGDKIKIVPYVNERFGAEGNQVTPTNIKKYVSEMTLPKEEVVARNQKMMDYIEKHGIEEAKKNINAMLDTGELVVSKKISKPVGEGETKTVGLAKGTEAKAVQKKLTEGFADLPEYKTVNMKDQAEKATALLKTSPEKARRIAMGEELPPNGVLPESVYIAVENKAIKTGDVETLRQLATESRLTGEATAMGQRIRTLRERNPDSPIGYIKKVAAEREAKFKKKNVGKTVSEAKKAIANEIKNEIKKKAPSKEDWTSFINNLEC